MRLAHDVLVNGKGPPGVDPDGPVPAADWQEWDPAGDYDRQPGFLRVPLHSMAGNKKRPLPAKGGAFAGDIPYRLTFATSAAQRAFCSC